MPSRGLMHSSSFLKPFAFVLFEAGSSMLLKSVRHFVFEKAFLCLFEFDEERAASVQPGAS